MGFGRFLERERLVDADLQGTGTDHGKQFVGGIFQPCPVRREMKQGWPGQVERARGKVGNLETFHRPRRLAETDKCAVRFQAFQRTRHRVVSNAVVNDIDTCTTGQFPDSLDEVVRTVVDHMIVAVFGCKGAFGRSARRSDHSRTLGLQLLPGNQPDAAGGGVEQDGVPVPDFKTVMQKISCGQSLEG